VNKVVLTFISGLVGFLSTVVTSVHGYEQDEERRLCLPKTVCVIKEIGTRTKTT
jgi:hypothetical protein